MTINQEPTNGSTYFSKAVPDIILTKSGTDTSVLLELKKGTDIILTEKYMFDDNNMIRIREIGSIFEKYLTARYLIPWDDERSENLIGTFSAKITLGAEEHTTTFGVIKCDAEISVDALFWCSKNFLTRSFREKRTAKGRTEYLSFLQLQTYGAIDIHCKLFILQNNKVVESEIVGRTLAIRPDNIWTFTASINDILSQWGLPLETRVFQYHIWLTGTNFQSSVYAFLVDESSPRNSIQFSFINCFGVRETFTATGKVENKKSAEYNQANIASHYRKITQNFVSEKTVNTGYLSDAEMGWLDDLVCSNDVAIVDTNEQIILVGIDKVESTENKLQSFNFTFRPSNNNHLQFKNANDTIFEKNFSPQFE